MTLRHPVVNFDEFRIHVIGNPSRLPSHQQRQISRKLVPVTERAFGSARPVKPFEVKPRTTDPEVSLLLYVDRVPSGGNPDATIGQAEAVGYLSTKNLLGNTMHVYAAAVDPSFQRYGVYEMCKRIAMALAPIQLRLHGGQPAFYTAQSPYLHIHRGLAEEQGMQPAHQHANGERLQNHLEQVADELGSHSGFERTTGIRRGAFAFNPYEGMTERQIREGIEKEAKKFRDPALGRQYRELFGQMNLPGGDALMAIRAYRPQDARMWKAFAELSGPKTQGDILAELLLGTHRREIQSVQVIPPGEPNQPPHLTITFKPNKWNRDEFQHRLGNVALLKRVKTTGIQIQGNSVQANLDAAGLAGISTALECTTRGPRK